MAKSIIDDDLIVMGNLTSTSTLVAPGTVSDFNVPLNAAIGVTKKDHLIKIGTDFGIESDTAPSTSTSYEFMVYVASGAATIRKFSALMLDTGTQANTKDFEFDLEKAVIGNASLVTTMSGGELDLDSDTVDNTPQNGTLTTTTMVAGDSLVICVTTPDTVTGAHGLYAWVELSEAAN
jgi:hypothetical protein